MKLRKIPFVLSTDAAALAIRAERVGDVPARETLLDSCFGTSRASRTCQHLRDGRAPAEGLSLSAVRGGRLSQIRSSQGAPQDRERTSNLIRTTANLSFAGGDLFGNSPEDICREDVGNFRNATRLVGTLRLWHVSAGAVPALLLGPLAVDPSCRKLGIGAALINRALVAAKMRGHRAVVLLGDAPYYARFGFSAERAALLTLPGPFERERLLGLELSEGALAAASGMIVATGASLPTPKATRGRKAPRDVPCAA